MAFTALPTKNRNIRTSPTVKIGASGPVRVPRIVRTVPDPFRGKPILGEFGKVRTGGTASRGVSSHDSSLVCDKLHYHTLDGPPVATFLEQRAVLVAMTELAGLLDARPSDRVPHGYLAVRKIDSGIVPAGWWQKLVFPSDRPVGTVDRNA